MVASQLLNYPDQGEGANHAKETVATFVLALATLSAPKAMVVAREDLPSIKFYTEMDWTHQPKKAADPNLSHSERRKKLAARFEFLENADGSPISHEEWADISISCRAFCNSLKGIPGALEPNWGKVGHIWKGALENYLVPKHPILAYGQHFWKIGQFMTLWYSDFARPLIKNGFFSEEQLANIGRSPSPARGRGNSVSDISDIDLSLDNLECFSSRSPSPAPPPPSPNTLSVPQVKRSASVPLGATGAGTMGHSIRKKVSNQVLPAPVVAPNPFATMDIDIDEDQVNVSSVQLKLTPASSPPRPDDADDSMMDLSGIDGDNLAEGDCQPELPPTPPPTNMETSRPPMTSKSPNPL